MAENQTNQSWWSHLSMAPKDAIFGLSESCKQDPRSPKVNFAIGVYSNDDGTPHVYPIVRKAEKELLDKHLDKEYAGIMGIKSFHKASVEFFLGKDNPVVTNNLYATAQTIAGTGALRLIAAFLAKHYPYDKIVYMSDHTWPNHAPIFREAGHQIKHFHYYNPKTGGLDSTGLYEDLKTIPAHSILLFQACGHNPTGVDPNLEEWGEISRISKERGHFIIIDNVYQGFATGNVDEDMAGLRLLVANGHLLAICHTFSKNMGLYGERVGTATLLCSSVEERQLVESQLKLIIRPMWSNPPINGARIATELLTNSTYKEQWLKELRIVFDDILKKRQSFYDALVKTGSQRDWSHILKQKGWFCFPGITREQAERLENEYAVFMTKDGRVPIVALRTKDIEYAAEAINEVTKD